MKPSSYRLLAVILCAGVGSLILVLLSAKSFSPPPAISDGGTIAAEYMQEQFTLTSADTDTGTASAVPVDLTACSGSYTISSGGSYRLTGALKGSIIVDAEEQIVHLIFDGVDVSSLSGPALWVRSAGKLVITSLGQNFLADSGDYFGYNEENACIYSECDITFNGDGTLDINGDHKDGIHSKDTVKLLGGTVHIIAKRDGIRGNDGLCIRGSDLEVESEGSGLRTTKSKNGEKGNIEVRGGDISIIAGEYALSAASNIYVSGCSLYTNGIWGDCSAQNVYAEEGCLQ